MAVGKVRTGVILIALGVLLLLNTTGTVDFGFWRWLGKLWPLILVAIGIEKIFSSAQSSSVRNLAWLSPVIIVGVVSYAVIAGEREPRANFWSSDWEWQWDDSDSEGPTATSTWSEPLSPEVQRVKLELELDGGRLTVRGGSDAGSILVARASHRGDKPIVTSTLEGGVRSIRVEQADRARHRGRDQWTMKLTDSLPVDLIVRGGAAKMRLDLTAVKIESLELDAGAADIDVVFGSLASSIACAIDCGVSDVEITIPPSAGLRLHRDGAISRLSDTNLDLIDRGDHSETAGFEEAPIKIELKVQSALSSLRLRRASGPSQGTSI
ncbi:MAG TPA: DUF5668 domain-containing protein [bacterium]|nr:DUF5668 domain-containing protein [bacterium]